jgi:hypothetical protein
MPRAGPSIAADPRSALGSETTYYAREYEERELKALSDAIPDLSLACDWLPVALKSDKSDFIPEVFSVTAHRHFDGSVDDLTNI